LVAVEHAVDGYGTALVTPLLFTTKGNPLFHCLAHGKTPMPSVGGKWQGAVAELIFSYGDTVPVYVGEETGKIAPFWL
jgi:hypothetical protein